MSASLSYYTLFSLSPLLLIVVSIVGTVFGNEAAHGELRGQLEGFVGKEAAIPIEALVANAKFPTSNLLASVVGGVLVFFGASGAFSELQNSLNKIWKVPPTELSGFTNIVWARLISCAMVLCIGVLFFLSLLVNALFSLVPALHLANWVLSFTLMTILFALIFKVLPNAKVRWREAVIGAAWTSFLFGIGKSLMAFYLERSGVTSIYGAAGSVVVILLWTYYSSLILFFGAELTQVRAEALKFRLQGSGQREVDDAPY